MNTAIRMASRKIIDIGANLTDPVFRGIYRGKQAHQDDMLQVLSRASDAGVEKIIVTAGQLSEAHESLKLIQGDEKESMEMYTTVGCHPTRCNEFEKSGNPDEYYDQLKDLVTKHKEKVVAIGECGLDYDRLKFCTKPVQMKYFERQLNLAAETNLPLFLHMRNAGEDFMDIYNRHRDSVKGGVAHCFTGSIEEAAQLMDLGLYIGITGCSLKTAENLEAMKSIPLDRLMVETDAPWCEIRNTHAGSSHIKTRFPDKKKERWEMGSCVKSRTEPCHIIQVLEVMAAVRGETVDEIVEATYQNTVKLFFDTR